MAHLPPSGSNAPDARALLEWPLLGPVAQRGNIATPCAWQAHQCWLIGRSQPTYSTRPTTGTLPWTLQPTQTPAHSTTGHIAAAASYVNITLRLSRPLQHLWRWGGGDVEPPALHTSVTTQRLAQYISIVQSRHNNSGTDESGIWGRYDVSKEQPKKRYYTLTLIKAQVTVEPEQTTRLWTCCNYNILTGKHFKWFSPQTPEVMPTQVSVSLVIYKPKV
jgi:hypothetical protein